MNQTNCLLELKDITKNFELPDDQRLAVLKGVSLCLNGPSIVALMGPNGCGKTTLLRIIAGELEASSGVISLTGMDLSATSQHVRAYDIGRVHQESYKSLASDLKVLEVLAVAAGRKRHLGISFPDASNVHLSISSLSAQAAAFFKKVELIQTRHLSGGQRQLLALVVAVLGTPSILLLDEHRASLDENFKGIADEILKGFIDQSRGLAIAASHDYAWVRSHATCVAQMSNGLVTVLETDLSQGRM